MSGKKADNKYQPKRAKRVSTMAHEHVLTLPRNGRKGCALCPYVEPRAKLVMPEHMKADRHAKGNLHPSNHSGTTKHDHTTSTANQSTNVTDSGTTEQTVPSALTADYLWSLNVPALYRLATKKSVRGRSTMTKEQLIQALL